MLIRKGAVALTARPCIFGFNPSYSGCWFGSVRGICVRWRLKPVSILLILDVDSEGPADYSTGLSILSFNPSYSGCWFGSKTRTQAILRFTAFQSFLFWMLIRKAPKLVPLTQAEISFNPSYSGCWFGRQVGTRKVYPNNRVSILLILDVDSEVVLCCLQVKHLL